MEEATYTTYVKGQQTTIHMAHVYIRYPTSLQYSLKMFCLLHANILSRYYCAVEMASAEKIRPDTQGKCSHQNTMFLIPAPSKLPLFLICVASCWYKYLSFCWLLLVQGPSVNQLKSWGNLPC